ncbi:protein phosphatase 1L-like [Limulus polyphemus]|uniref:Protein phosphatase 1L-like n=1 Tax=Limulus polyphemus TaxID=6850 RepID=A0ABM1BAQ2_LIMPO|nr:protein phosphatase 1L-like [Limulus polyphemus]
MDDELENEVLFQTLVSHLKIFSHVVFNLSMNFSSVSHFLKYLRWYVLKPETIALGFTIFAVFLLCHSADLWYKVLVTRLQLAASLSAATGKGNFGSFLNARNKNDRLAWELSEGSASVYALQGRRPRMEDRFSVLVDKKNNISLYGIFDGHGGEPAAEFVKENLFKNLLPKLQNVLQQPGISKISQFLTDRIEKTTEKDDDEDEEEEKDSNRQHSSFAVSTISVTSVFSRLITEEILSVDKQLLTRAKAARSVAGTTALVTLVYDNHLIVANVGDSRGVISDNKGNAIPLSFDHKPQQLKEHKRIKEAGGFITFNGVWRVAGILATSRALGDFPLKERNLITAEPDILTFNLSDLQPRFMVLATDGLWDIFTNEEAVTYISEHLDEPFLGAKSLATQAYVRGSLDNVTVLVVNFSDHTAAKAVIPKCQ